MYLRNGFNFGGGSRFVSCRLMRAVSRRDSRSIRVPPAPPLKDSRHPARSSDTPPFARPPARPFFLRGVAHAVFVRYRTQRYKDVWLARLEEPLWEVQRDVAELLPRHGRCVALGEYTWALNGHVASVPLPTGEAHIPAADQERGQLAAVCARRPTAATPGDPRPHIEPRLFPSGERLFVSYRPLHHAG